ncbi:hypothetical protein CSC2_45660 [Clostridium zeae]|uniref:Dipeptidyl-peptidase IV n=2 Tax=Clostridium zeae TaxID=2759022 RepID=A0ABQ1EH12_9CLOT|nr:hypothetical protein CSC2_45660 [Clostridium zeae]
MIMKKLRVFLLWSVIALIIQNGVFLYFEKVYLGGETTVKAEKVEKKKISNMKDINIPSDATDIKMSHDGTYIAFMEDGALKVGDRTKGDIKTVKLEASMEVNYTKWVTDGDFLIIAEKTKASKSKPYIDIHKYDASRDEKVELTDLDLKKDIINLSSSKDNIEDMAFATSSNVMYFKIGKSANKSDIYKINVMSQLEKTKSNLVGIGAIDIDPINANLLYEQTSMVKLNTGSKQTKIKNLSDGIIIGHSDNSVFIGKGKADKIEEVIYGDVDKSVSEWQKIKLDSKVDKKDIFITAGGRVFIKDSNKSLTDAITKKTIKYEGTLLDVNDKGILSNVEGKSKFVEMN